MTDSSDAPAGPQLRTGRARPERPSLETSNHAPVVARVPPPLATRLAEALWISGLAAGALTAAYFFITRDDELSHIRDRVLAVDPDRATETLESTADIIFWSLFGVVLALVLIQLWAAVAFANRRPRARAWLGGTLVALGVVCVIGLEFLRRDDAALPLRVLVLAYVGLLTLALLVSLVPSSRRWTRRRVDVRRGPATTGGADL